MEYHYMSIESITTEQIKELVIALKRSGMWIGKYIADNDGPFAPEETKRLVGRAKRQLTENIELIKRLGIYG